jgi:lysophospholipase L1-like esterase
LGGGPPRVRIIEPMNTETQIHDAATPSSTRRAAGKLKRARRLYVAGLVLTALLLGGEGIARFGLGLGTPLLYEKDTMCGYRVVPNQNIRRFGNHLFYNAQGLRSSAMTPLPNLGITRVLCVGDSITYGGAQTDQSRTYPALLKDDLMAGLPHTEVLNASAGGWAPDNELGFLREYGTFGSQIVVLEIGTNDLCQGPVPDDLLETNVSFPTQTPMCALQDGFSRYFLPTDPGVEQTASQQALWHDLLTIRQMVELVRSQHAQPVILHMEMPDGMKPKDPVYTVGRAKLLQMAAALHVPVVLPDDAIRRAGGARLFRDSMHPNADGNVVVAKSLTPMLLSLSPGRVQ